MSPKERLSAKPKKVRTLRFDVRERVVYEQIGIGGTVDHLRTLSLYEVFAHVGKGKTEARAIDELARAVAKFSPSSAGQEVRDVRLALRFGRSTVILELPADAATILCRELNMADGKVDEWVGVSKVSAGETP